MAIKELQAYELLREEGLSDIQSVGYLLRHRKKRCTGIMVIANDDDNKVFQIIFRTSPVDSTGVAHILEHCSLCGSRKVSVQRSICGASKRFAQYLSECDDLSG